MSIDAAAADLEARIYAREIVAGKPDSYARAFAQAFVAGYVESFEQGLATGYAEGRVLERERLQAMNQAATVHGPEAQRWLMASELEIPAMEILLADGDPDPPLSDGSEPLPAATSCH